jgi:hypothetical protein
MTFGIEITSKVDKMARKSSQLSKGYEFFLDDDFTTENSPKR